MRQKAHPSPSGDSVSTVFIDSEEEITLDYLRERGLLDLPLYKAAKKLGLSVGCLKKICRSLGLTRWPFRQRNSLRQLMAHTAEHMDDMMDEMPRKAVMETLKRELDDVQGIAKGITASTRRFRQTIFKLNHEAKKKQQRGGGASGSGCGRDNSQAHMPTAGPYDEPMPAGGSFTSYCALEPSSPELPRHMGMNRLQMTHHSADSLPVEMPQYHPHMLTFPEGEEVGAARHVYPESPGLDHRYRPPAAAIGPRALKLEESPPRGSPSDLMPRGQSLPEFTRQTLNLPGAGTSPRPQRGFQVRRQSLPEYTQCAPEMPSTHTSLSPRNSFPDRRHSFPEYPRRGSELTGIHTSPRPRSSFPDRRQSWSDATSYNQPLCPTTPGSQHSFAAQRPGGNLQADAGLSPASPGLGGRRMRVFTPALTPAELQWLVVPREAPAHWPPPHGPCTAPAPRQMHDTPDVKPDADALQAAASPSTPLGGCPPFGIFDINDLELMSALDLL